MEGLSKTISQVFFTSDAQMAILGFLCFVGAWVVVTKLVQFVFSILWPLLVLAGIFVMVPNFSAGWFTDEMAQYSQVVADWLKRTGQEFDVDMMRT